MKKVSFKREKNEVQKYNYYLRDWKGQVHRDFMIETKGSILFGNLVYVVKMYGKRVKAFSYLDQAREECQELFCSQLKLLYESMSE